MYYLQNLVVCALLSLLSSFGLANLLLHLCGLLLEKCNLNLEGALFLTKLLKKRMRQS